MPRRRTSTTFTTGQKVLAERYLPHRSPAASSAQSGASSHRTTLPRLLEMRGSSSIWPPKRRKGRMRAEPVPAVGRAALNANRMERTRFLFYKAS
jgi:hypothetical protein